MALYLVMNLVVVPLSAMHAGGAMGRADLIHGLLRHMFLSACQSPTACALFRSKFPGGPLSKASNRDRQGCTAPHHSPCVRHGSAPLLLDGIYGGRTDSPASSGCQGLEGLGVRGCFANVSTQL
jgi:hypothetical protein